jgi:glucan phosphoethanolaminetransferase (alkaline phosphatase superfamily)
MHHTAAFVWMSPLYKEAYPQKYNNLLQHKHKRLKTDFLYHSVIDAASIETDVLDSSLSVF